MNYELGYYSVNGKKYTSKLLAILDAQQSDADISWYFYQDLFAKVNWKQEPEQSLDELYKLRALQIREKYDYVIIWASGGADSNNVVRTFLNNNIRIDEIIAMAPMNGLNNWNWNTEDRSVANTVSETKFALFPLLDEVANKSPNTKITINDIFDDMLSFKDDEWLYDSTGHMAGPVASVFGRLDKFPHLVKLDEQGKKIACVYGIDKPVVKFHHTNSNELVLFLSDVPSTIARPCFRHAGHNAERVLFYHSHEMPEIMVKQAHVVAKALFMPNNKVILDAVQNQLKATGTLGVLFTPDRRNRHSSKDIYQRGIVPYIYPTTYTKDLFQCVKVDTENGFFPKNNDWLFELHSNTRLVEMIKSNFLDLYKMLKPKYLNPHGSGFRPFFQAHFIGNRSKFESIK
jgi:hypothetical protein